MSERTSYAPGTPCWVDLGTADVDAAARFYTELLGWRVPEAENVEETGGYRRVSKDGADVAGLAPLMQEGQPTAWTSYISVADADATTAAVKDAGGSVMMEPMAVRDIGKFALYADPTGAVFGVWEPGAFPGAGRVNEPGALSWNELNTRDVDAAKAFYGAVFGWDFKDNDMGETGTYTELQLGGSSVGGMLDITGRVPDEVPAHWLAYFAVENTDAALETIKGAGGGVNFGPVDIPAGRFAVVHDPQGAVFAVIQMPEEAAA